MPTLIITRGLPGSGKSHWARDWVAVDPNRRVRVNRDDLRGMLHDGRYVPADADARVAGTEQAVIAARNALVRNLLDKGRDVVCDDTNLPQRVARELRAIARCAGADFEVSDFRHVPLELCLARNAARTGQARLADGKIRDLHRKFIAGQRLGPLPDEPAPAGVQPYEPQTNLRTAYVVDVDGTVALMDGRDPYDTTNCADDRPNRPVVDVVAALHRDGHKIVFCSGRKEIARDATEAWIIRHIGIQQPILHMRADGDNRRDATVKLEIFDRDIRHRYHVLGVLDDRQQVVDAWRSIGLTCLQVAPNVF